MNNFFIYRSSRSWRSNRTSGLQYQTCFNHRAMPVVRPSSWVWSGTRRYVTTEAGDDETGHIQARSNEGILFFDNYFPLNFQWLLKMPFRNEIYLQRLKGPEAAAFDPIAIIKKAMPGDETLQVTSVLPRLKEGGAFVKFSHDDSVSSFDIEAKLRDYLRENRVWPWWNPLSRVRVRLIQGRPWVEDLYRPPSR